MGVEEQIADLIRGSIDRSDAHLLAYAVMSNHIHVILVQGRRPLAGYMQPLLRRIALLVIRRRMQEGHVFAGRYHSRACQDPEYFRSMVAYVHLNPVRAGICRVPDQYRWTSHHDYARGSVGAASGSYAFAVERGVRVFARCSDQTLAECRQDYRAFARWRLAMDQYLEEDADSWLPIPREPLTLGGDLHWQREWGTVNTLRVAGAELTRARRMDLRDMVAQVLDDVAPDLPLDQLCSGGRSRPLVRVRRQVIARALTAGYQATRLAAFLNVSPSAVSLVWSSLRGRSA
jgi:REP element-mobilizing transposase RayT